MLWKGHCTIHKKPSISPTQTQFALVYVVHESNFNGMLINASLTTNTFFNGKGVMLRESFFLNHKPEYMFNYNELLY